MTNPVFNPKGSSLWRLMLWVTEESFHSKDNDGGFWATVFHCPITFTITAGMGAGKGKP